MNASRSFQSPVLATIHGWLWDVRPLRPQDEALYGDFFAAETADDVRLRFFGPVKTFDHTFFSRFTHVDYSKAMALIAQKYKTNDPKVIEATYNDFKRLMPLDAAPSVAGAQNVIAQLQAIGLDVGSKNVNDHLDSSIIEGLKKDGYFEQMAKTYPIKQ